MGGIVSMLKANCQSLIAMCGGIWPTILDEANNKNVVCNENGSQTTPSSYTTLVKREALSELIYSFQHVENMQMLRNMSWIQNVDQSIQIFGHSCNA